MFWDQDILGSLGCFEGIGMLWGIEAVPVLRRVCHQRGAGGLGGLYPFYRLVFFHFQSSPELQAGFLVWFWGVAERFDASCSHTPTLVPFSSSGLCPGGFENNSSVGRAKS